jgi:putative membrane-bound dehydrogenase-like protein
MTVIPLPCPAGDEPERSVPHSLFDGTSLNGWEGDPQYWRVDGGAIVGEIFEGQSLDHNTWLVWRGGDLVDFDLRLKVKLTGLPAANSGIQFRCQVDSINHVSGYQADFDQGATWLGRIYDEHGRALLVERGSRVHIAADGTRKVETFAPAQHYAVLFRENDWNDYRIVAVGDHVAVFVNGTLFSELKDEQNGEQDLSGQLAFQLHSGPQTRVEFRDISLSPLDADTNVLAPFAMKPRETTDAADAGHVPAGSDGQLVDLGFESGDLSAWTATGDAFDRQPVNADGISQRWPGQVSNKQGKFFIGGYEHVFDRGRGTLTSVPIRVTHRFVSFWFGGGQDPSTRAEVVLLAADGESEESVLASVSGRNQEQMRRVAVDVSAVKDRLIWIRLVDENAGAWGHLNFDDARMHDSEPADVEGTTAWRSTFNPVLQHLVPNPVVGAGDWRAGRRKPPGEVTDDGSSDQEGSEESQPAGLHRPLARADVPPGKPEDTLAAMHVPPGFSVDLIAAEPDIHQPIAFTFDERGRIWVVEAHSYPQKRPDGEGLDKIIVLEDSDNDGSFEKRTVFIEGLNLVSGIEVGFGGVWIGAAPELLFIPDRNGDCVPDRTVESDVALTTFPLPRLGGEGQGEGDAVFSSNGAERRAPSSGLSATFSPASGEKGRARSSVPLEAIVLLDGFDYADTHETLNSFTWGPDGWLYGNQGVFNTSHIGKPGAPAKERITMSAGVWRYHPTKHVFEVFAHGGSNPWGLDFDEHGQLFMTHCRSYWGRGGTTHVMPGGHYWNQSNSGYAPFISAHAPSGLPWMQNFLLASARYDHGEGGAGKPGTDAVYGGHSPVGTMIYLGDNWPAEYHNHLFTLNLHGHQMNHQVNEREAGGYNTRHAGTDVFFCGDRSFVGVDLQYGPDGTVCILDWSDQRHCHNPDTEQWDRSNGRIYRMKHDATWKPVRVNYAAGSDMELAVAQQHVNDWHVRTARRVLAERASVRAVDPAAVEHLRSMATTHPDPARRLRSAWALHGIGQLDSAVLQLLRQDTREHIRGWAIRLMAERPVDNELSDAIPMAVDDASLLVCRELASAIQRVPPETGWRLAEALAGRVDVGSDRDLPLLLWCGVGTLLPGDVDRALALAETTVVPSLKDWIHWYAAKTTATGRDALARSLISDDDAARSHQLKLLELAVRGQRGIAAPEAWSGISTSLYDAEDVEIRTPAESIGAVFGDPELFVRLRDRLREFPDAPEARMALPVLAADRSSETLSVLMPLLQRPDIRASVIPLLSGFDSDQVALRLIELLPELPAVDRSRAIDVLVSRAGWAHRLLDELEAGRLERQQISAWAARQIAGLGDASLTTRLEQLWGTLNQAPAELAAEILSLASTYKAAPLWAYDGGSGVTHFRKLCAQCHQPEDQREAIAPKLQGSGTKGVEYLVENILNPNAVIGRNYQAQVVVTIEGRVLTGLIEQQTDSAITLRTLTSSETIARDDIEDIRASLNSFMPEGLLKPLNDREKIELLKYLMSL